MTATAMPFLSDDSNANLHIHLSPPQAGQPIARVGFATSISRLASFSLRSDVLQKTQYAASFTFSPLSVLPVVLGRLRVIVLNRKLWNSGVLGMSFLTSTLLGLVIGIASITPGLSGGALAAALGLYEQIIRAVSRFFQDPRKNLRFLLPIALGSIVGIVGFSNVMEWLMRQWPDKVRWLFLGLVAGSLPSLVKTANTKGFRWRYLIFTLLALAIIPAMNVMQQSWPGAEAIGDGGWQVYIISGVILAFGTIVPGLSSSFILLFLGVYDDLLQAVSSVDLVALILTGAGFVLGALLLLRLVEMLFDRYHPQAYYTVLGFLLASAWLILPELALGWRLLADAALFALGVTLSLLLLRVSSGKHGTS